MNSRQACRPCRGSCTLIPGRGCFGNLPGDEIVVSPPSSIVELLESFCSLEQLVASLCAADEEKSASGTYHPKTEGYTGRYLYRPLGLLHCGECTWTRIRRQRIVAITWHFSQGTLLKPLTVIGASASCFGERYWDVLLSQNFDENNNTQTSTDCCTVVLRM